MSKVSIIMPLYNSAKYLREAIESIQRQTFQDWEFIIINEYGSNDGSKEIVEEYAKYDSRIKLIQNDIKLGISESLNIGIRKASGQFIARMDGDDISLPSRLEKQVKYLEDHPNVVMCGTKVKIFGTNAFEWELETDSRKLSTNILFYSPCVHPTVLIRKNILDNNLIKYNKEYTASEDYDIFSKICEVGSVANIDEVLFKYRIMGDNATFQNNDKGLMIYNKVMKRQFEKLGLEFSDSQIKLLSPHYSLKGFKGREALEKLCELELLLKKILIANSKKKIYDIDLLMSTLHKRFREAYDSLSWACKNVDMKKADEFYNISIFKNDKFYKNNYVQQQFEDPVVSVLMPTYNSEKYILDSIWSILKQTYKNFELLILNEYGSDDDTVFIAEMFQDNRIKIIQNKEKKGLAESLNEGIKIAMGKYLARIDADDLAHPERLKKQVQFLDENLEYGVCGAWQHHFGLDTEWIHKCSITHEDIQAELIYNCDLCHSVLMLRKEVFINNNLFYDNSYAAEDYELWTRAIKKCKFANIPQVLGEYRVGEDNITAKKMDILSRESGELVARNIRDYFDIIIPNDHILYLSGWRNEFNSLSKEKRKKELDIEKDLLKKIFKNNKKLQVLNNDSLLKAINKRWRSVTNNWEEDGEIYSIDDLLQRYEYGKIHCRDKKQYNFGLKRIIKLALYKPYVSLRARTVDRIAQQIWDIDGHIYDYKEEIKNESNTQIDNLNMLINTKFEQFSKIIGDSIKISFDNLLEEQRFLKLNLYELNKKMDLLDEKIGKINKENIESVFPVLEVLENELKEVVKNLNYYHQSMDTRIWKSELLFLESLQENNRILMKYGDIRKEEKKIVLLGTPYHSNMGDHAQAYCINEWCKKYYSDYRVIEVRSNGNSQYNYYTILSHIREKMNKEDWVIIHSGGYHISDIYMSELELIKAGLHVFQNYPILIMPQSIYFEDKLLEKEIFKMLSNHKKLYFIARDNLSYKIACHYLNSNIVSMIPDIVHTLIGKMQINTEMKEGILICKRPNDIEAKISGHELEELIVNLESIYNKVDLIDTNIVDSCDYIENDRRYYIEKLVDTFSKYKVVITDRMHGIIYSLIAGTPVIVLPTNGDKVKENIKLYSSIKDIDNMVFCIEKLKDLIPTIKNVSDLVSYNSKEIIEISKKYMELPENIKKTLVEK